MLKERNRRVEFFQRNKMKKTQMVLSYLTFNGKDVKIQFNYLEDYKLEEMEELDLFQA